MGTIANAQAAMGYLKANQRPACNNCVHSEERVCVAPTWWCTKGGFLTTALAVCERHEPCGKVAA